MRHADASTTREHREEPGEASQQKVRFEVGDLADATLVASISSTVTSDPLGKGIVTLRPRRRRKRLSEEGGTVTVTTLQKVLRLLTFLAVRNTFDVVGVTVTNLLRFADETDICRNSLSCRSIGSS